jgi:hypothetical protein
MRVGIHRRASGWDNVQEKRMSKSFNLTFAFGLVAFAAACAQPEPVYVEPEPVSVEPVYTGKYK